MKAYAAALLVVAFVLGSAWYTSEANAANLQKGVNQFVGAPVRLQCETVDAAMAISVGTGGRVDGWVTIGETPYVIHLAPWVCSWLAQPRLASVYGQGLQVVLHEATHLRLPLLDEAQAECYAYRAVPAFAKRWLRGIERAPLLWGARHAHEALMPAYRAEC